MDKYLTRTSSTGSLASKRPAEEDSEWRQPRKSFRPAAIPRTEKLNLHNRYDNLPQDEIGSIPTMLSKKTDKVPPIFIDVLPDWTHASVKNIVSKYTQKYNLQYRGDNRVAVLCESGVIHQTVKDGLLSENVSFHTFSRKEERPYKVVIRGLPPQIEDEAIAEFVSLGFPNVTISKLSRNQDVNNLSFSPIYLGVLPAGSDITKFRNIKRLCHCVVQLEKFKAKSPQCTQCYRCQKFGHASRNCNLPVRCVKCTGNHETKDCPKKDRSAPATCCNCGENHPANFTKCSERLKYIANLKQKLKVVQPPPKNYISPNVDGRSWASVAAPNGARSTSSESARPAKPPKTQDGGSLDSSTVEMLNILCTIRNLKSKFINCPTMMDKVILIMSELGQYV